jgi:hypothetical protein
VADDETRQQLDELRDAIAATRRTRDAHQRRLYVLQEQAARLGKNAPPEIVTEIGDIAEAVQAADAQIKEFRRLAARLELAPQSALALPDTDAVIPELLPAVVDARLRALDRANERFEEALSQLWSQGERSAADSRDWRRDHHGEHWTLRIVLVGGAVVLLVLVIGVVVIAIKVF